MFLASAETRPFYQYDNTLFRFTRMGMRILGTPLEEEEYYNSLFDIKKKETIHVLSEELDKSIESHVFKDIQDILQLHQKEAKGLSVNRLIAIMYGKNLIPKHKDQNINRHVQLSTIKIVEHFKKNQNKGLQSPEFRRFLTDIIKWLKNHWEKWSKSLVAGSEFPKVIWYGELTVSQKYFLLLLMEFGCDVLIFHPEGKDLFGDIDTENANSIVYEYSHKGKLESFPNELRDRQTTVAYRANKQLEKMLHDQNSGVYKPWQFREHIPSAITMKMTYDDIFIYAKEKAMIRPEFKITGEKIHIPVIFAKVKGVSKDRKEYWDRMNTIMAHSHAISIRQFPYATTTKANYQFHYQHSLDREGALDPDRMIKGSWWRYGNLPVGLQRAIAYAIKDSCEKPKLKKLETESENDLRLFLFKQGNMIPDEILQLLQKFDYSQEVPRIVLYNMETNGEPSREDAALLNFLNEFGVDIILYNPAGHLDIEHYIEPLYYDVHWLEEVVFEQSFQDTPRNSGESIIKKIIKRYF